MDALKGALPFEQRIHGRITAKDVSILQINTGYRCNLECGHCHVTAGPRTDRSHVAGHDGTLSRSP